MKERKQSAALLLASVRALLVPLVPAEAERSVELFLWFILSSDGVSHYDPTHTGRTLEISH